AATLAAAGFKSSTSTLNADPSAQPVERIRALGPIEPELLQAGETALVHVASSSVLLTGRIELLHYLREQSVSQRYHRYGNLAPARLLPALRAPRAADDDRSASRVSGQFVSWQRQRP
ncbi:MAG TPA: hypothetical protein VK509_08255, partial [Polyangiales bacterium]|nr:hypothetical protein [Polyangiales bacterium]